MFNRRKKTLFATFAALACLGGSALAGVVVYSNGFSNRAKVLELKRVIVPNTGKRCKRQAVGGQMMVTVGKSTIECDYSPPFIADLGGDDLDIFAKVTLSPASKLPKKTFLSVGLRGDGDGTNGKYRLDVSPGAQRFYLRRYDGTDKGSEATLLESGKKGFIKKAGKPNKIRLKVANVSGGARITAKINGRTVASVVNPSPLTGRRAILAIGRASGSDRGGQGFFDNVVVSKL